MKKSQLRNIIKECIQEIFAGEKIHIDDLSFVNGMSVGSVSPGESSLIKDPAHLEAHKAKLKKAFGNNIHFEEWNPNRFSIINHPLEKAVGDIMQRYYYSNKKYTGD